MIERRTFLHGNPPRGLSVYQAIARRDAEAARAAIRLHLANSRERLRATLERSARPDARRASKSATPRPAGRVPA
jgi:hypothetical protein